MIIHNQLVLVGGLNTKIDRCTGALSSYDSETGSWVQALPAMPTPRASAAAFVTGDYLVVVGGQRPGGELVNVIEVLHIPSCRWETATRLPQSMAGQSIALCSDKVCLLGGIDTDGPTTSVYLASVPNLLSSCHFLPLFAGTHTTGKLWRRISDCPFPLMTAVSFGDQILALGGQEITSTGDAPAAILWLCSQEVEEQCQWCPIQRLPSGRQLCCAAILPDHQLVIAGGLPHFNTIDIAEIHPS